ncbi:unnamed protein product, partial [Penicillium nalgiovense]
CWVRGWWWGVCGRRAGLGRWAALGVFWVVVGGFFFFFFFSFCFFCFFCSFAFFVCVFGSTHDYTCNYEQRKLCIEALLFKISNCHQCLV